MRSRVGRRLDHTAAAAMVDPSPRELGEEPESGPRLSTTDDGPPENRRTAPFLADNRVEERRFGQQRVEVFEHAARHEDQKPGIPRLLKGLGRVRSSLSSTAIVPSKSIARILRCTDVSLAYHARA
ncbi:MAG: hypothetical protein ACRD3V_23025 [Vicinamibacteria bacterium]